MPNIMIYGLEEGEAVKTGLKIDELLGGKYYGSEYVVTFVPSQVRDRKGVAQPYLKLVTTPNDHVDDILVELRKVGMDIEVSLLTQFIPKT